MCIFQPFTVELHSCSYARQSTVIGFRKRCFVLVHSEVCCGSVRFFAANSAGGEGETGDIILLNEIKGLSKMSLCALSYKRVCNHSNTRFMRLCVCVCVCVPRAPHRGLSDTSALEISSGSGLNSLPVRTLRSPGLCGYRVHG